MRSSKVICRSRRNPPSASMTWPVTHALSSDASHATTGAMSSGRPQRPAGNDDATDSRSSSDAQPVSTGPGLTALTVIPRAATASASDGVIWCTAPLLSAYGISRVIGP